MLEVVPEKFILRSSKSGVVKMIFLVWCRLFLSCRITAGKLDDGADF